MNKFPAVDCGTNAFGRIVTEGCYHFRFSLQTLKHPVFRVWQGHWHSTMFEAARDLRRELVARVRAEPLFGESE